MKRLKNIFLILAFQTFFTLSLVWFFNAKEVIYGDINILHMLLIILNILLAVSVIIYMKWMDKKMLDALVDKEVVLKMKALDEEQDIRNHEIFRDLQLIKVLAENNQLEDIEKIIS